jgi:uncharacterized protein YuzE
MKSWYDKEEDILNIRLAEKKYWKSVELPNGILLDIAEDGTIINIEIWRASKIFFGEVKKVIETAQPAPISA